MKMTAQPQPMADMPAMDNFVAVAPPSAAPTAQDHPAEWQQPAVTRWLHWTSAVVIVVCAAAGLSREVLEADNLRNLALEVHRQSGLFIALALAFRLAARAGRGFIDHAGQMKGWQRQAARAAHVALYVMLLLLPVLGVLVSQAHGAPLRFFGLFNVPALVEADADLADELTDYHTWAAWGLLFLVLMHVAAALWHHWIRRDNVLAAMWPTGRLRR